MSPPGSHAYIFQHQPLHAFQPAAVPVHGCSVCAVERQHVLQSPCATTARCQERRGLPGLQATVHSSKLPCASRRVPLQLFGRTSHTWHMSRQVPHASLQLPPSLEPRYAKCCSAVDEQNVFGGLSKHDVRSWNDLLSAHAQQGRPEKVLQLYYRMQEAGVHRDVWTFVRVLQACCALAKKEASGLDTIRVKSLKLGKAVHADCRRMGCESEIFVANSLISMYGKCGSIVDAQRVFKGLCNRDVVSWTAMLAACVQQGLAERALQLYEQMQEEGVSPNNRTFVIVLQACGILGEKEAGLAGQQKEEKYLERGKVLHADAWRRGYDSDVFVGNTLVSMYGKCGKLEDAQEAFDSLSSRDAVSWNAILASHVEQGKAGNVFELYEQMRIAAVSPDARTFVGLLQACSLLAEEDDGVTDGQPTKANTLKNVKVLHAAAQKRGHHSDVFVGILLISVYRTCAATLEARQVFDGLRNLDVGSWNAMLAAYCQQEQAQDALELYEQMIDEGVSPDARTFVSTLQACGRLAETEDMLVGARSIKVKLLYVVKVLHASARVKDYDLDVYVGSVLISLYGRCASIADARHVFDRLTERDVVAWNAMLTVYVEQGHGDAALQLFRQMQREEVGVPSEITLVCIMQACSSTGSLACLKQIHNTLTSMGRDSSLLMANTLIGAYGRCASMVDAQNVFDALPHPDVVSWTALMAAYARQGDFTSTLQRYSEMQVAGVKPDGVTFLALISACSHAGLVTQGFEYFNSMTRDYGITPVIDHYVSLVNLLGRAGCFSRIKDLLSPMPVQPNLDLWLCLLGACQKFGKVELGEEAFNSALRLHPHCSAAYVMMSNIYYDAGQWDLADALHKLRQEEGAWKQTGQTWTESAHGIHSFVVSDNLHLEHKDIYDLVGRISSTLEARGSCTWSTRTSMTS